MTSIFIVDDDDSIRNLYKRILTIKGYDVIGTAENGADAVANYETFKTKPDIILMDYRMPVKNGLEATKEILQIDNKANIIFASADPDIEEMALSMGAKGFNQKPFRIDQLINNIQKLF